VSVASGPAGQPSKSPASPEGPGTQKQSPGPSISALSPSASAFPARLCGKALRRFAGPERFRSGARAVGGARSLSLQSGTHHFANGDALLVKQLNLASDHRPGAPAFGLNVGPTQDSHSGGYRDPFTSDDLGLHQLADCSPRSKLKLRHHLGERDWTKARRAGTVAGAFLTWRSQPGVPATRNFARQPSRACASNVGSSGGRRFAGWLTAHGGMCSGR